MVAFKFLLAASSLVAAWPEPTPVAELDQRALDCSKVTGCYSILKKLGPPASSFCSTYLKAGPAQTTTITPAAVSVTTSTTTVYTYTSPCGVQKRNVPLNYRGFEFAEPQGLKQRDNILPLLAAFAAAKISEGCSCLGVRPRPATTFTTTAATPTTNVLATTTTCKQCQPNGVYVLGPKIEHRSLDWGGSFPGSHDFHRTSNAPNEDIYILKPKDQRLNLNGKRIHDLEEELHAVRFGSKQPRSEDVEDSADEGKSPPVVLRAVMYG